MNRRRWFRTAAPVLLLMLQQLLVCAQPLTIPANTGYSNREANGGTALFPEDGSLRTTGSDTLHYFFYFRKTGMVNFNFVFDASPSNITISFAGNQYTQEIKTPLKNTKLRSPVMEVKDTGFQQLTIYFVANDAGKRSANEAGFVLHQLQCNGSATEGMQVNKKPHRNAASVHLWYPVAASENSIGFYNEIKVPAGADIPHSYYMACGFSRGYFGIQVISDTERRVIFSVWDAGTEANDRDKVPDSNKVQLLAKGEDVVTNDFGNEGTGGHSHWLYNWKAGETYKFYVTAMPDSASNSTDYTAYFFMPEVQQWKLMAVFRAPKDNKYLRGLYSFSENFDGSNGHLARKAFFGNQWVQNDKREWKEITTARFTTDETGRNRDRIDIGAGASGKEFYLWNGGFTAPEKMPGDSITRTPNGEKPKIDLYRNADSLAQAKKDAAQIADYCKRTGMNNCNYKDGIYYYVIQPGSKPLAKLTDTLVVYYRGTLLDGTVFDKTNEEPATFPLKRLIKGWQTALQLIGAGGRLQMMLPSAQAYGLRHLGLIKPNSVLVFDVEIEKIKE